MDIKEVKKTISENTEMLERLLSEFGFHSFSYTDDNLRCAVPNGDNPTSVSIYLNENLYGIVYTRGSFKGDVFHIIEHITANTLGSIFKVTRQLFGFEKGEYTPKIKLIEFDFKKYKKSNKEHYENVLHDESILNKFVRMPHQDIFQEGISPLVANMFNISYVHHYSTNQGYILFPHYDWIHKDKIVGIQGRVVGYTSEECNQLGIRKYTNYIKGYKKQLNLYGWHLSYKNVEERKQLIIFEGEKSVLKQFSWNKGKGYSVALGGHAMSKEQIRFISNNTPIDCEIIFALDKDVMVKEFKEFMKIAKQMALFRKTSYLIDEIPGNKILKEKDSPADKGRKVFEYLMSTRKLVSII
ncbi:DNA primase [Aerococcaceae bacterium zg-B36]|uniref:DNA primase n=1 Tax=Aerococcaceae bacterium zg-252 TaxID=2796928 RepID=UPI001BD8A558|nr:DNA primase [Aerococcaceae bacterium zg-B36]